MHGAAHRRCRVRWGSGWLPVVSVHLLILIALLVSVLEWC